MKDSICTKTNKNIFTTPERPIANRSKKKVDDGVILHR